jgi:hypothetical protein
MKNAFARVLSVAFLSCVLVQTGCTSGSDNSGSGGGSTPVVPVAVNPTVSSVSPAMVTAGAASTTLTVTGTGFTSSTTVQVGSAAETTTYSSSTQISATVPASQLASGALLTVIAVNPSGSSASGAVVNLEVDNPSPAIASFVPSVFTTGAAATTLAVTGKGFVPSTMIQVGGTARSTSFVSTTQVNVILTLADLATPGNLSLVAVNPAPGGGTSAASSVAINNPIPGALTLTPTTLVTGSSSAATIMVGGSNFLPSSVVQVGGAARATTYVSGTQLTFQLTVADQATAGRLAVTVVTPAPGGGTSPAASLTLAAPTPTPVITSVSPTQFIAGSSASSVAVFGTNLTLNSVVLWNGSALTTTSFFNSYYGNYLVGAVPASLLASVGTASVTVSNPTSTPALSNALSISIVNPPAPTLASISPASGPINTAATITLVGTGFTAASTVGFNGVNLAATFNGSTSLTVTLPASSVATPGNESFTITTPAPGGGTTAPLLYTAYIGIANNSMIYNPVNGLFYVSVPSSAGAPYGNSVVSVDPATGALGTPIQVGSEPDKMALTSDGNYLWVGLDGASAVRKVNLATGTAGLQFALGGNTGVYQNPGTALALVALPGATDSVVVSSTNEFSDLALAIYDSGVLRGTTTTSNSYNESYSLLADGTRGEIYSGSPNAYYTYTYSASGLTLKASSTAGMYASYSPNDEMQIAAGRLYTDFGGVYDAEAGSLLGTLYVTGTTPATGSTTVDASLGKAFVLDSSSGNYGTYNQIQTFNTADFTSASSSVIPVNVPSGGTTGPSRLSRWGTNGLAFRTSVGVVSLRSNLVKDLSTTSADLGVSVSAAGTNLTGANTTYTATITDAGPSASTNVAFAAFLPASGSLVSITPSAGTCSSGVSVTCDLGSLASGASATVTVTVLQQTAGSATLTAQVSGSENDPNAANNQASSTVTITGATYTLAPVLSSISPSTIVSGASDTTITLNGTGFTSGSSVLLGGSALSTSYGSATQLTATVPAARLTTLGWAPVTVTTPAPGGGTTAALPLSVYSIITLGVNHILYDPYSRNIMASVGSGSSGVTGNSIVAITPDTATVGTPVSIGSQPTNLALTSDGQILYTILSGSGSVARFNMLTQQADFTYTVPTNTSFDGGIALRGIATQPGTENTIALDIASFTGNAIYDFNSATKTAAIRGQASGPYSGSCIQFLDAADLLAFDTDTSGSTLDHYTVTSAGFTYYNYQQYTESTLNHFGCFKLSGGLAFSVSGGVANPSPSPALQLGVFPLPSSYGYSGQTDVAPDTSLGRTFFAVNSGSAGYSTIVDSVESFNNATYLPSGTIPVAFAATEGANASYTVSDLIRWGQDGLAVLTTGGHIYLIRGAAVVPQLLANNTAASITASSSGTIAHGTGNTLLTLTGSNFVPGVAVTWNGSYRTTTIVDATHVTVAIPASDLAAAGSGSLVATNPGAPASSAITVTIN